MHDAAETYLITANLVLSAMMTGLIWMVQLVHYPLFRHIAPENFVQFEKKHQIRISVLVMPLMLAELIAAALLQFSSVFEKFPYLITAASLLLLIVFISTIAIQAPIHRKLALNYNRNLIDKLIRSNIIRTLGWTLRTVILMLIL